MTTELTLPEDIHPDIRLIDDQFLGLPHLIGTYVLLGDEPALVDPGPSTTIAGLEAGLAADGLSFDDIRALLLTHIHLDHAGATGTLVTRYPHLRVYVHQVGAPHVIDPERLIRSATRLYGDDMDRLWGEIRPVPESNVTALSGGETLNLGRRMLHVYDTPGHASHHVTYFDPASAAAFVGDVTGVRFPDTNYARPATPPPDIDLEAWHDSLDTLLELDPSQLLLTHFGPGLKPEVHIESFRERLTRWAQVAREGLEDGESESVQINQLRTVAEAELDAANVEDEVKESYELATPIDQSWQGLARYWRKRADV
ncbi:MAG: Hydroxyacylglutathione hydrolase GloC [Anaerolineales bacterium]|nr:Hydroxyacylglutathione hydrolase GloC [Anaerolineales bacterium]